MTCSCYISSLVLFNLSWISKGKEDKVNRETGEYSIDSEEPVTSPNQPLDAGHCTSAWEQGQYFFLKRYVDILTPSAVISPGQQSLRSLKVSSLSRSKIHPVPHPAPPLLCQVLSPILCLVCICWSQHFSGQESDLIRASAAATMYAPKKPRQEPQTAAGNRPSSSKTDSGARASEGSFTRHAQNPPGTGALQESHTEEEGRHARKSQGGCACLLGLTAHTAPLSSAREAPGLCHILYQLWLFRFHPHPHVLSISIPL